MRRFPAVALLALSWTLSALAQRGAGARSGSPAGVVLVFRDGRAPEQIHNYMLTRTTLYVQDGRGREIPLDEIDLAATQRLNGDVGVEFRPPDAVR